MLAQEIQPDRTVTYLYEPDSFVPLAQIESAEGRTAYAPERVHLAHQAQWELPTPTNEAIAHLHAYAAHQHAQREHAHQADWQARLAQAEGTASADTIRYYHCDHLGTPLELLDESGKTVWAAHYKAWGRIQRYDTRKVEQPLRFQGQYEDAETGLFYNRHRYYDPNAARFITQDPIGLAGGINVYQYAPNPTGWVDPWGLSKKPIDCAKGALIFAEKKAEIEIQIAQHDYTDIGHTGANPTIPGGVSGAIANERATGLPTKGKYHSDKGIDIRNRLKKILKQADAAYDLNPCQKELLHAQADPYITKINVALATPRLPGS